jgi:U6 snRNA-associated Sm-like protein LSm4
MNLVLREVVQTNPDGNRFHRLPEVYVRGNNVRLLLAKIITTSLIKADQIPPRAGRDRRHGQGAAAARPG